MRDRDHGRAGNAIQARGEIGGVELAIPDDEEVFASPFGNIALGVQKHGFIVAISDGFLIGQNRIDIVAGRFGAHHGDVDMVAGEGRGLDPNPFGQAVFAKVGAPRPGRDRQMNLIATRVDSEFFAADPDQWTDVAAFESIGADHFALRGLHGLAIKGHHHLENVTRLEEAASVFGKPEDACSSWGLVSPDPFKHPHAVVQRVGEHMDLGFAPFDQFAVKPNPTVAIRHRHDAVPLCAYRR